MRTAGIICEYNPFHWGHRLQIEKLRDESGPDTAVVCLMSGNFVQRGEPAVFPKGLRARAAVLGGADLVLELPLTAAVSAAGYFAEKGVECLGALGCVDTLAFGSECGDLTALKKTAEILESDAFETAMREILPLGGSFAAARGKALSRLGGDLEILKTPNNALGVEYLRALNRQEGMKPWTMKRETALPPAAEIRGKIREGDWLDMVPHGALYQGQNVHTLENGERAMLGVLRTLPVRAFQDMAFDAEGLWSKVEKACRRENSLAGILTACKSKRYAMSRLRRILLCLFLGLGREEMELEIPYLRVLAFNSRGQTLLGRVRKTSALPLISGAVPNTPAAKRYFALEQRAADLYTLFAPAGVREPWGTERAARPEILTEELLRKEDL